MRDPYDTGRSVYLAGREHEGRRARDELIERLAGQVGVPVADSLLGPERWEVERARCWRVFDFAVLDAALERLRGVDGDAYHGVMGAFVYGWLPESSRSERGLVLLDGLLPVPLRAPGVRVDRDGLIGRRAREGWPSARIAGVFGLSVRRVNEIVQRFEGGSG